ncbi:MAG: hypothetical protein BJ554DRAFT_6085 [Olpidium bornovanus]|uniref:Uncharacterized protein n=1 Tax=Olpidium bornovanus TaxID=278681 RepID=A0A8H8DKH1_9FUNG|nr:MAG: hypothetical protein BJ554DRAFT_6085 [Olpidium bornovanus]
MRAQNPSFLRDLRDLLPKKAPRDYGRGQGAATAAA